MNIYATEVLFCLTFELLVLQPFFIRSWHKYALLPQVPILSIMSENGRHKIGQWQHLWLCFFDFEAWIFIRLDEK